MVCQLAIFLWGNAKATASVTVIARYVYYPFSSPSFLRLLEDAIISPFCFLFGILKGSLICMQRADTEEVPGCFGSGVSGWDYCYDPRPRLTYIDGDGPYGECVGNCNDDDLACGVSNASRNQPGLFRQHSYPKCLATTSHVAE
jgi:hypothetical protein